MYNFNNDAIPLFFPVVEGALLRPWFSSSVIDQGLQLLRDQQITGFHSIRNAVGAIVGPEVPVILQFEKNTRLHQGFSIRINHCGMCRLKPNDKGCVHMAALAILSLTMSEEHVKPVPMPLGFAESPWLKIGTFLYDWLSRAETTVRCARKDGCFLWEITATEGLVRVAVPDSWVAVTKMLFSRRTNRAAEKEADNGLLLLNSQLQLLAMTENERALINAGSSSIGWKRDSSVWTWLARMLYACHGNRLPELQRELASCRFSLRIGVEKEPGALLVALPREKTWELVRNVSFSGKEARILPPAKECYRLCFNAANVLEVRPILRLADGRVLSRNELAGRRFSGAYYLEGEGFLPTIRIPAEGTFTNPEEHASNMPLFGFLESESARDEPFTVVTNEIPVFLNTNRKPLHYPDNIVEPELLDLQVCELPDRLFIDSFKEHEGWYYLSCRYGLGNTEITLADIFTAQEQKLTSLPGKKWLKIDGTPLSWLYDLAHDRRAADGLGAIRLSYREMIALTAVIPEVEITIKKKSLRHQLAGLLNASGWSEDLSLVEVPSHLRSYQRERSCLVESPLSLWDRWTSCRRHGPWQDPSGTGSAIECGKKRQ